MILYNLIKYFYILKYYFNIFVVYISIYVLGLATDVTAQCILGRKQEVGAIL